MHQTEVVHIGMSSLAAKALGEAPPRPIAQIFPILVEVSSQFGFSGSVYSQGCMVVQPARIAPAP